jgi:hypothetical protein
VKTLQIPGLVNVDFADVKAVMKNSGTAMLGVGVSSSKNRAQEAAEQATLAPLIGSSIEAATGVVYNITGGKDITLQEVNKVSQVRVGLATLVLTLESLNGIYTDEFRKVNIMGFNIKTVSRRTNMLYLGV